MNRRYWHDDGNDSASIATAGLPPTLLPPPIHRIECIGIEIHSNLPGSDDESHTL